MTYQPPATNDDEPEIILSCYPTLQGLMSCGSDPEHILDLYLKNLKNTSTTPGNSNPDENVVDSSNTDPADNNKKPSSSANDDDEQKKTALDLAAQRRLRIIAWYLFFIVGDDEIWERERGEKLEEIEREKANVREKHSIGSLFKMITKVATMSARRGVTAVRRDYRDEEKECMKRMMLRQEVFADWKAGKHGFFYDDKDMPDLGVDDDRIYKMTLIHEEPSWQGYLEKIVRAKVEFDRMENVNREYDSDE